MMEDSMQKEPLFASKKTGTTRKPTKVSFLFIANPPYTVIMKNPETKKGLDNTIWPAAFHREYGDDIIAYIVSLQPHIEEDNYDLEFDFFYHKLSIIRSLVDNTILVSEPTDEMKIFMAEFPLSQKEFAELHSILVHLREKYPDAQVDIPDALVKKAKEVVDNFSMFSSLFSLDGARQ